LLLEFINIPERYLVDTATNLVIDWLLGPEIWIDKIFQCFFLFILMRILLGLFSPGSAENDIG